MGELPARGQFTVTFPMGLLLRHYEGEKVDRLNRDLSRLILKLEADTRASARTTTAQGGFHTEPSFVNRKDAVVTRFRERVLIPGVQHGAYGNAKIHPRAGDLVVFPCYQVHFSHPFSVPGERILIASDIRVYDQFDELGVNHYHTMSISSAGAG